MNVVQSVIGFRKTFQAVNRYGFVLFWRSGYSFSLGDAESGHKFPKLQKTTGCETGGETLLSVSM